jgi:hypothetical protein
MGVDTQKQTDFTEDEYLRLMELASRKYTFVHYDENPPGPCVCWRHDVDYSPQRALALARIEAERSLKCIYHVYLTGRYYSLLEPPVTALFREIAELGHVLGLHFDMDVLGTGENTDTDRILERIDFEKSILEKLLYQPMRSISFHNYALNQERLMRAGCLHGMINVCSSAIWDGYKYVSDSNGIWRHERLRDVLSREPYDRLHVLTHPVWWTPTPQTPMERLKRAVEGRANAGIGFYLSLLKQDGRFEHIADQIGLDRGKD